MYTWNSLRRSYLMRMHSIRASKMTLQDTILHAVNTSLYIHIQAQHSPGRPTSLWKARKSGQDVDMIHEKAQVQNAGKKTKASEQEQTQPPEQSTVRVCLGDL